MRSREVRASTRPVPRVPLGQAVPVPTALQISLLDPAQHPVWQGPALPRDLLRPAPTGPVHLHHPLCTLHDTLCRMPCKTRSRLAGCVSTSKVSKLLALGARLQFKRILPARARPAALLVHPRTTPTASGWSDSRPGRFAPAGRHRLSPAHENSRTHSPLGARALRDPPHCQQFTRAGPVYPRW